MPEGRAGAAAPAQAGPPSSSSAEACGGGAAGGGRVGGGDGGDGGGRRRRRRRRTKRRRNAVSNPIPDPDRSAGGRPTGRRGEERLRRPGSGRPETAGGPRRPPRRRWRARRAIGGGTPATLLLPPALRLLFFSVGVIDVCSARSWTDVLSPLPLSGDHFVPVVVADDDQGRRHGVVAERNPFLPYGDEIEVDEEEEEDLDWGWTGGGGGGEDPSEHPTESPGLADVDEEYDSAEGSRPASSDEEGEDGTEPTPTPTPKEGETETEPEPEPEPAPTESPLGIDDWEAPPSSTAPPQASSQEVVAPSPTQSPVSMRPTAAPFLAPTPAAVPIQGCPPVAGDQVVSVDLPPSASLTVRLRVPGDGLCTLTRLTRRPDGGGGEKDALAPVGRTYDGHDWENVAGPHPGLKYECSSAGGEGRICRVALPELKDGERYALTGFPRRSLSERDRAARLLERATFGVTRADLDAVLSLDPSRGSGGSGSDRGAVAKAASWIRTQMDGTRTPPTSHRAHYRRRANPPYAEITPIAAQTHPCRAGTRYRRGAFSSRDADLYLRIVPTTLPSTMHGGGTVHALYVNDQLRTVVRDLSYWGKSSNGNTYTLNIEPSGSTYEICHTVGVDDGHPVRLRDESKGGYCGRGTMLRYSPLVPGAPGDRLRGAMPAPFSAEADAAKGTAAMICGNPPVTFVPGVLSPTYRVTLSSGSLTSLDLTSNSDPSPVAGKPELGLLAQDLGDAVCASLPAEAGSDPDRPADVFGALPTGEYYVHDPRPVLLENTLESPLTRPGIGSGAADAGEGTGDGMGMGQGMGIGMGLGMGMGMGGGKGRGGETSCPNVARTFLNEHTCKLSDADACKPAAAPRISVRLTEQNLRKIYQGTSKGNAGDETRYVYAMDGLRIRSDSQTPPPCGPGKTSRWAVAPPNKVCALGLHSDTVSVLSDLLRAEQGSNPHVIDILFPPKGQCHTSDTAKRGITVPVDGTCYLHVHQDHLQVFDLTYWTYSFTHPGNAKNRNPIKAFAERGGTRLVYPIHHDMGKWQANRENFGEVGRLGDGVRFEDLPEGLRTEGVARLFGGDPSTDSGKSEDEDTRGGTVICGSPDEVSNDPSLPGTVSSGSFDFSPNARGSTPSPETLLQRKVVWTDVALSSPDQLRQRMAWALSQILVVSPAEIQNAYKFDTEPFLVYYDIFVRNAFGNYRDVLKEVSYSPLMAEMLSFLRSKSSEFHLENSNRIVSPDENYAREVMQLFSVGMHLLNDDGTPRLQPATGDPVRTYANDEILSLARAWTGFDRRRPRSNAEDFPRRTNRIEPLEIVTAWRDRRPKLGLGGEYVGERAAPPCVDLPPGQFLRRGARYRLLGGSSSPEWLDDPPRWEGDEDVVRVELEKGGALYAKLCNPDVAGKCQFAPYLVLDSNLECDGVLCELDHLRVIRVVPGIFYEYVRPACVERAFFDGGRKISWRNGERAMCADPGRDVASAACCGVDGGGDEGSGEGGGGTKQAVWNSRYVGERVTYDTNVRRCRDIGRIPCDFHSVGWDATHKAYPWNKLGHYHWTDADCATMVKIEPSDGSIAIVHRPANADVFRVPKIVRRDTSVFFRAVWEADDGAGDNAPLPSPENDCAGLGGCEVVLNEGRCLCATTVVETRVFSSMPQSPEDVLARLTVGAPDPASFDAGTWMTEAVAGSAQGLTAHHRTGEESFSVRTVFEVLDPRTGRTFFLRNADSIVRVGGAEGGGVGGGGPSFRNPPHFVSLADGEGRDAHYETDALIDQYVYHPNAAPFLSRRLIQRFGISNPSPRYVKAVADAFRTGLYVEPQSDLQFGGGSYGDLGATCAAVLLDREATSAEAESDPTFGSLREPLLKVIGLMRSLEFEAAEDSPFAKLVDVAPRIGQMAHEIPTVFSFFLPEFEARGPATSASLVVPEAQHLTGPKIIDMLNGAFSLIKWGFQGCWNGFGKNRADGVRRSCNVRPGDYGNSVGRLTHPRPESASKDGGSVVVAELSTLLTAGRLSKGNREAIETAYSAEAATNATRALLLAQQLIASSAEFHATGLVRPTGEKRAAASKPAPSSKPYRATVMLMLSGGIDSYNVLVPGCNGTARTYDEYSFYRGELALQREELLLIDASASASGKICPTFGLHHSLRNLRESYSAGDALFFANVGALNRPVTPSNYLEETRTQLFSHNEMQVETKRVDPFRRRPGTGILGRLTDALTALNFTTGSVSVEENSAPTLTGRPGVSPPSIIVGGDGATEFDERPQNDKAEVMPALEKINGATSTHSNLFGETWSSELLTAIAQNEPLVRALDETELSTAFPDGSLGEKFGAISKLIKGRSGRGTDRDVFYVDFGGFDHHWGMKYNLREKLDELDPALGAFRAEMKAQGRWDEVVLVAASDFGRTLTANSRQGSDHGWAGHYFAMGGKVRGGRILGEYPRMLKDFPADLTSLGPLNLGRGRMIPTHSNDAIWNAVAQWMGVPKAMLDEVLPNRKDCGSPMFEEVDVFEDGSILRK